MNRCFVCKKKIEYQSFKPGHCLVWLKYWPWFWSKLLLIYIYPQFGNGFVPLFEPPTPIPSVDEINLMVSDWKIMSAVGLFIYILKNSNPLHARLLCVTCSWNWPNVSREEYKYKTFTDWRRRIGDPKSWHLWFQLGLAKEKSFSFRLPG